MTDVAAPAFANAPVALARDGAVASLTVGQDDGARIRLTPARLVAIAEAVERINRDRDVALLVIFGGRREFCIGADLDLLREASGPEAERYLRLGQSTMAALSACTVPTVAAVGGLALGGGFEFALACDLRWAHRRAAFGLPEVRSGVVPAWGATAALAREVPAALAWELLAGERISAQRALDFGLVGRLFQGAAFEAEVVAAAKTLASLGRDALAGIKRIWNATLGDTEA